MVSRELGAKSENGKTLAQKAVNWYLNNYLRSLFAGAFDTHDYSPIPPVIPLPKDEKIQEAVELLSKAKKPVILVGSQATLPPVSVNILRESLEVKFNYYLTFYLQFLFSSRNSIYLVFWVEWQEVYLGKVAKYK